MTNLFYDQHLVVLFFIFSYVFFISIFLPYRVLTNPREKKKEKHNKNENHWKFFPLRFQMCLCWNSQREIERERNLMKRYIVENKNIKKMGYMRLVFLYTELEWVTHEIMCHSPINMFMTHGGSINECVLLRIQLFIIS